MGKNGKPNKKNSPQLDGGKKWPPNGPNVDFRGSFAFVLASLGPFSCPCPIGGCFPFGFPFFSISVLLMPFMPGMIPMYTKPMPQGLVNFPSRVSAF